MELDDDKIRKIIKAFDEYGTGIVCKENETVENVVSEDKTENVSLDKEDSIFKEFLASELGSESEMKAKKAMALGAILADDERSPEEIAASVDEGMTRVKVAYKLENEDINIGKALEIIIDRVAARADAFVQSYLDMNVVGEIAVNAAAIIYPPILNYKPVIKIVLKRLEPLVRQAVSNGIKTLAKASKNLLIKVETKVKAIAKNIQKTERKLAWT